MRKVGRMTILQLGFVHVGPMLMYIYKHDLSFIFPRVAESLSKIQQESIS